MEEKGRRRGKKEGRNKEKDERLREGRGKRKKI